MATNQSHTAKDSSLVLTMDQLTGLVYKVSSDDLLFLSSQDSLSSNPFNTVSFSAGNKQTLTGGVQSYSSSLPVAQSSLPVKEILPTVSSLSLSATGQSQNVINSPSSLTPSVTGQVQNVINSVRANSSSIIAASSSLGITERDLQITQSSRLAPHVAGRLIVKFKTGISTAQSDQIKKDLGVASIKSLGFTGAQLWNISGISVENALAKYRTSSLFAYIEPDYIVTKGALAPKATLPNDPSFNQLWGLNNTGQNGGTPDADIDAPEAWDIQKGNPNLVIGVIDTGVDYNHQDLVGNIWTNPGEIAGDGIDNDGNGYIDDIRGWDFAYNDNNPSDVDGHGTHVSGTIAGKGNNGVGVTGVAWNAKIMPLKFLDDTGSGSLSNAILAIDYATAKGVKLTNNSWGGGGFSQALYDSINAAGQQGSALFIAAAGNSGVNADVSPMYPAGYNLANIVSVASTTRTDSLSSFSNYGLTSVDLGAPGSEIYSLAPNGRYATLSGTSMASPHVAGAAALLWSQNPTWTAQQVKTALMNTGDSLASLAGKTVSGKRLNIYNALAAANLPSVTVAATDASAAEGTPLNPGQYTLTRTGSLTNSLTVNVALSGTATNGTDYTTIPSTVFFAAGSATALVNLNVIDDTLQESAETATLTVIAGSGYTVGSLGTPPPSSAAGKPRISQSTATITIADNDTPVSNIINAVDTGWYDDSGSHEPTNTNYIVGDAGDTLYRRNWMSFNLPTFTEPVVAAQLKIKTYEYLSADASETYELRDVTTPVSTLVAGGSGLTSIYNDLGTGAIYGSRVFTSADSNRTITIDLTPEAVSALNTKSGQAFALGGWLTTLDTIINSEYVFGFSNSLNPSADVQLVLSTAPALPVVTIAATDASAAETIPGATTNPGRFTLTRTGPTTSGLTVNVIRTGTATNGVDYVSIPATVTFRKGSATALVNLNVIDDSLVEGTETAILKVGTGNGYTVGTTSSATVSIADNETSLAVVTLSSNYSGVSENGKANLFYTFTRSVTTSSPLTVNFTLGGTATRNSDYDAYGASFLTPTTGNIVFAAGQATAYIGLITTGDTVKEANETIAFTLAGGTGYTVGTPTAVTTTIINDDRVLNQQGTAGNDVIEAGTTSILSGKAGNDILIGSNSNEILAGGLGNDTLTGGAGFDTFHFASRLEGIDTLKDFNVSQDIIQVSGAGFGGGLIAGESISSAQFSISLGSVTANTRFIFDKPTGKLYFDIDGSGAGAAVQFASLTANLGLTEDNIFVA